MSPSASGAPKKTVDIYEVATHLWGTADELRANSHLKAAEYSIPVLGLIFLKFVEAGLARLRQSSPVKTFKAVALTQPLAQPL